MKPKEYGRKHQILRSPQMSSVYDVLLKPVVTEKSTMLQEQGKYVFEVTPTANKIIVKEAIEKAFDVNVLSVNITMNRGKV